MADSSARWRRVSRASSVRRLRIITWQRERRAAFNSKDGFSVVAPIKVIVPSSSTGKKASCWDFMKRWISSTKSSVCWPSSRRMRAASKTALKSLTPAKMADSCSKCNSECSATIRAMVVLPQPGGPQRIIEDTWLVATIRWRGMPLAVR